MRHIKLYAVKNWGNKIAELAFELCDVGYEIEFLEADQVRSSHYQKLNPLMQIPTLLLPSGEILTESLAICLYINSLGQRKIIPDSTDASYPSFLRWSVFLVSSIYSLAPTNDHPDWFVKEELAQAELQEESMKRTKERLLLLEKEIKGPWFLGQKLSLIDLYLTVMSDWDPGRRWFQEHCPRMMELVSKIEGDHQFKKIFERNK